MNTLSNYAKDIQSKAQIKVSMAAMKRMHIRKAARYIERVTGVDVEQILKEKGVEL